jgi:DNA-binding NtrC family response regulator
VGTVTAIASAEQLMTDPPMGAPVRILDERGHLRTLEEIERDLIQLAIEIYAGHMSEVARRLGIGRSTLYRKVREQGLDDVLKGGEADEDAAETGTQVA